MTHTELLEKLCAIDSRTVVGAEGATKVAATLGEGLSELGFAIDWTDAAGAEPPRGRHLRAVWSPRMPRPLLLLGHTDTVLSPSEVPFRLDAAAGRVYGAGVCDMKGGCVILLEALRLALQECAAVRDHGLVVLLNAAEEFSEPSFRRLARTEAQGAAVCLNFEPAGVMPDGVQEIVVARKGTARFELSCFGRAAHAGNAHAFGVNAIRELARQIERIESVTDHGRGVTANVGRIRGGHVSNQVAEEAFAGFELRAFDPQELERARATVQGYCAEPSVRSVDDGTPARVELRETGGYPVWAADSGTDALARRYAAAAQRHGVAVKPVRRGGASDANHVADLVPTLDGLGMVGGHMHSSQEWADLAALPVRARIAADVIKDLCG